MMGRMRLDVVQDLDHRQLTDRQARAALAAIGLALADTEPWRRAELLADAVRQLGCALESCLGECRGLNAQGS